MAVHREKQLLVSVAVALEIMLEDVRGDHVAEAVSFSGRMMVVHAAIDARVVDFLDNVVDTLEDVRGVGDLTIDRKWHLVSPEELLNGVHRGLCHAAMIGRILRMSRSRGEWYPIRIRDGIRITVGVGVMNCRV